MALRNTTTNHTIANGQFQQSLNTINQSPYETALSKSQMNLNAIDRMLTERSLDQRNNSVVFDHCDNYHESQYSPHLKRIDEQVLSQKMSQLSTRASKKEPSLIKEVQAEIEKIPNYLTKQNPSFRQILGQALSSRKCTSDANDGMERLRKIGLGQLISPAPRHLVAYPTNISIWPKAIKVMLQLSKEINQIAQNERCLQFVEDHLNEFDNQLKHHQMELSMETSHLQGYSLTIQKCLETYIEQNLHSLRTTIEHQIELVSYDYHIQALKLEYYRHKPNKYQEELMKQVCQSKYEQEASEQEYQFVKQQMIYYEKLSQSFQCSPIAHSVMIDSIQNPAIQQELFKQFKAIADESRANLLDLYLQSATDQREEYKKKYDTATQKINASIYSSNENAKISSNMAYLINERCNKISQRIQCIYKFKTESFLLKP